MQTTQMTSADHRHVEAHGLRVEQAEAILRRLQQPPRHVELLRAATRADGVTVLDDVDTLAARFDELEDVPGKFVPMSGAASRMFAFLDRTLEDRGLPGDEDKLRLFAAGLRSDGEGPRFAFSEALSQVLRRRGHNLDDLLRRDEIEPVIRALLAPEGLDYRRCPKALVLFHRHGLQRRSALEEHLRESLRYARGRLHYTLSPEHRARFLAHIDELLQLHPELRAVELSDSTQHPSTDSLALDAASGELVRDDEGRPVFFPAGHGSLLRNLQQLGRPVVLRNVDNLPRPQAAQDQITRYHRALAVLLADLKGAITTLLCRLDSAEELPAIEASLSLLRQRGLVLHVPDPLDSDSERRRAQLRGGLDRPLKIVGLVRNQGEPGGGPFVIRVGGVEIVSIVEKDEIALRQRQLMRDGEFFNPVDLVLDPTRADGSPYDLRRFVNDSRAFVVRKPYRGRDILRMEHPGLWNGAMDGWSSLFVELPIETFAPVKEVVDLMRPSHQA